MRVSIALEPLLLQMHPLALEHSPEGSLSSNPGFPRAVIAYARLQSLARKQGLTVVEHLIQIRQEDQIGRMKSLLEVAFDD